MPGGSSEFAALPIETPTTPLLEDPATVFLEFPTAWDDEFWYQYTPTVDGAIGCRATLASGAAFDPHVALKYGTPGSLSSWFYLDDGGHRRPDEIPLLAGETVFIRVKGVANLGSPVGTTVRVEFYRAPLEAPRRGDLFIPDDVNFEYPASSDEFLGWPGAVLDPTTGVVRRLHMGIPAGESGDVLDDGTILLDDSSYANKLHILEPSLWPRAIVAPPVPVPPSDTHFVHFITRYSDEAFLVSTRDGTDARLWVVDRNGGIQSGTWTLAGATNLNAIGCDGGLERVYYAIQGSGAPVKRYSLSLGALSDLAPGVGSHTIVTGAIVVLEDQTILVGYHDPGPGADYVRRYGITGTVLNTYMLDSAFALDRICRALDSPTSFWVWLQRTETSPTNLVSRFKNIEIISGADLVVFDAYQFLAGVGPELDDPPRFGHANSCPFMVLRGAGEDCDCTCPPTGGGGGTGHTGGNEGDDPTRPLTPWSALCAFGGDVPTGINGTDTENWAG